MISRASIGAQILGIVAAGALSGCGNSVSQREYFDTAFIDSGYSAPEIYGYVPPYEERAVDMTPGDTAYRTSPRVIVIGSGDEVARDLDMAPAGADLSQSNSAFVSSARARLDHLDRELQRLQANAEVRGAAAEAALEPAARDLRMYRDQVEERLYDISSTDDINGRAIQREEVADLIADAEESLDRATREVYSIPSND